MEQQTDISAIDRALAAAKARRAAKEAAGAFEPSDDGPKVSTHPAFAADQKKEALRLAREADRAKRAEEREQRRAAKPARTPKADAHMKKVKSAEGKLPALTEAASVIFNELTVNFGAAQLGALALHIQHYNRARATERAVSTPVSVGSRVRIVGGDPRYIGQVGVLTKAQRIRCFVEVPGRDRPIYLFTSDVEAAPAEDAKISEAV